VLLGPDGEVAKQAPTAADLYGKGDGYWLDFPGDPLDAGCSYEQWFNRIAAGKPTTAYAHIVGEQGKLALQYWFYYPFNDWNNKTRERLGDDPARLRRPHRGEALGQTPALVGYSQHEGAESASWDERSSRSVALIRWCTRARAPIPTSSSKRSSSDTARRPASAVMTHASRPTTSRPRSCCCHRRRQGQTSRSPGSATSATGVSRCRGRTAGPQAPHSRASGPARSAGSTRSGGLTTCRCRRRARSRPRQPASFARRSRRDRRSTSAFCVTRSSFSGSWQRS
jgi:hypothetical protein